MERSKQHCGEANENDKHCRRETDLWDGRVLVPKTNTQKPPSHQPIKKSTTTKLSFLASLERIPSQARSPPPHKQHVNIGIYHKAEKIYLCV